MSQIKIDSLAPEQEAMMSGWREKWIDIGLSTDPISKDATMRSIEKCYTNVELTPPTEFVWTRSPWEGAIVASMLIKYGDDIFNMMNGSRFNSLNEMLLHMAYEQVNGVVSHVTKSEIGPTFDQCVYGQHDAFWLSFYTFFGEVCGLEGAKKLNPIADAATNCGWWWPFDKGVVVSERPQFVRLNEAGQLHCETGPAITYSDGWSVYAYRGIRVPQHFIEDIDNISVSDALGESNVEYRRVLIALLGPEKLAASGELALVDEVLDDQVEIGFGEDDLPTPLGLRGGKLWKYNSKDSRDIDSQWVSLKNSTPEPDGSVKDYWVRVPPTVTSVREAVAWTFGMEGNKYVPIVET